MKIGTIPSYEELFGEPAPTIDSLIGHICSDDIIAYLALINAELHNADENDLTFQKDLIGKLLNHWLPEVRNDFLKQILPFIRKNNNQFDFFKSVYITYFIHNELLNYRKIGCETKSKEESLILKAYFIYAIKYGKEQIEVAEIPLATDQFFFQKLTWPFNIKQFDFNEKIDPVFQLIRMAKFLEHLYLNPNYKEKVTAYLNHYGKDKVFNFVFDFMNIINLSYSKRKDNSFYISIIKDTPGYSEILNNLSINIEDYKVKENLQKDYLGIRQNPLLKINNDQYIVLNWKFLLASAYVGIIFDFSRISKIPYNTLKNIAGEEISETKIFRGIMQTAFYKKHRILNFDNKNGTNGFPDFYLRDGNYIYLFEFKDYLVPTEIVASNSYEVIRNFIDERFIQNQKGKSKGITQLLQHIIKIENGGFEFDNYENKSIKKRNLTIIPIIVTTHYHFQMGGINTYLIKKMDEIVAEQDLLVKKIFPVTIIDFFFLFRQVKRLKEKDIDLLELIKKYHNYLQCNKENIFKANCSFEETFFTVFKNKGPAQKQTGYIDTIFNAVEIKPELTN